MATFTFTVTVTALTVAALAPAADFLNTKLATRFTAFFTAHQTAMAVTVELAAAALAIRLVGGSRAVGVCAQMSFLPLPSADVAKLVAAAASYVVAALGLFNDVKAFGATVV